MINSYDRERLAHFEFLLPEHQQWFSAKEVAAIVGKTDQYVRDAFENQKILGHMSNARAIRGKEKRRSYQIHRDCVLLFLLETANYEPPDFMQRVLDLLSTRSRMQLREFHTALEHLISAQGTFQHGDAKKNRGRLLRSSTV